MKKSLQKAWKVPENTTKIPFLNPVFFFFFCLQYSGFCYSSTKFAILCSSTLWCYNCYTKRSPVSDFTQIFKDATLQGKPMSMCDLSIFKHQYVIYYNLLSNSVFNTKIIYFYLFWCIYNYITQVKVHIKRYSTKDLPESDEGIAQWCRNRFIAKVCNLQCILFFVFL